MESVIPPMVSNIALLTASKVATQQTWVREVSFYSRNAAEAKPLSSGT